MQDISILIKKIMLRRIAFHVLCIVFMVYNLAVSAQEAGSVTEIGLAYSDFSKIGLTCRTGKTKSPWRLNALYIMKSGIDVEPGELEKEGLETSSKSNGLGIETRLGREFRVPISENISFRYGADLSFKYIFYDQNVSRQQQDTATLVFNSNADFRFNEFEPGANLVIGFCYSIGSICIGIETLPSFSFYKNNSQIDETYDITYNDVTQQKNYSISRKTDSDGYRYSFSFSSTIFSIVYQF